MNRCRRESGGGGTHPSGIGGQNSFSNASAHEIMASSRFWWISSMRLDWSVIAAPSVDTAASAARGTSGSRARLFVVASHTGTSWSWLAAWRGTISPRGTIARALNHLAHHYSIQEAHPSVEHLAWTWPLLWARLYLTVPVAQDGQGMAPDHWPVFSMLAMIAARILPMRFMRPSISASRVASSSSVQPSYLEHLAMASGDSPRQGIPVFQSPVARHG